MIKKKDGRDQYPRNYQERIYDNQRFPALIALVAAQPSVVLDVGCGAGANLRLLKERGHTAIDLMLSSCEARIVERQGISCCIWDITYEALQFLHNSYDALTFSHVFRASCLP